MQGTSRLSDFPEDSIEFIATHMIEMFRAPLMTGDDSRNPINDAFDLYRMSTLDGFDELFLCASPTIEGVVNGETHHFPIEDFLRWQLERSNDETLYHLQHKTGSLIRAACSSDFIPEDKILNIDEEFDKDPTYDPDDWLNENIQDKENKRRGVELIARLRKDHAEKFYTLLVSAILDSNFGVLSWLETEIDDLDSVRQAYSHWHVPLMIVSQGFFRPYIEPTLPKNLMMEQSFLRHMYVRNYDEGEPRDLT